MTPDQTATARTAARIAKTIAQTVSAIEKLKAEVKTKNM